MYKGKRQMPNRTAKRLAKEIDKKGNATVVMAKEAQLPATRKAMEPKEIIFAKSKKILIPASAAPSRQKHEHVKKESKRTATSPEIPGESAPANAHREGKRWIKTLNKQTQANKIVERRHSEKARSKNRF